MKLKNWVFRHFFREDYEHLRHLVDDVITLEGLKAQLTYKLESVGKTSHHNFGELGKMKSIFCPYCGADITPPE